MFDKLGEEDIKQLSKTNSNGYNPLLLVKLEAGWINEQKDFHLKKTFMFTNRLPPLVICLC